MKEDCASRRRSGPARRSEAVSCGMDAHAESKARGDSHEQAVTISLGRAIERYLDSLDHAEHLRILLGLHRPGALIPEEAMLPDDEEGRRRALEAAAGLAAAGQLRRVRSREHGSIFWIRLP
ncbi:MAG: hypothetical protein H0U02_04195 [Rubrobacter sp.]|nr:hypothetical protein [Rubrobacter sp.]